MSTKKYAICGGAIGATLCFAAFVLAGAGHGSNVPLLLFFALLVLISPLASLLGDTFLFAAFFGGGPLLYVGYAILLGRGNRRNRGGRILLILMLFHFGAVGLSVWIFPDFWNYESLKETVELAPVFFVASFVLFILALFVSVYSALKTRGIQDEAPRCRGCGYNLTGNTSGICPECGEEVQQ